MCAYWSRCGRSPQPTGGDCGSPSEPAAAAGPGGHRDATPRRCSTSTTGRTTSTRPSSRTSRRRPASRSSYDVFDSNEVLETKLLAGKPGYDVVVPSAPFPRAPDQGRRVPASSTGRSCRTWSNLDPGCTRAVAAHDPGNEHAVIYMWGTTGIGYNADKIKAIMPDAPVD
ncbi:MAG: hypothetical protein MZV49_04875 [Rhodopseudomonas palustris]|nr:hypothetical protein [Rhodopseudomonas palustris]